MEDKSKNTKGLHELKGRNPNAKFTPQDEFDSRFKGTFPIVGVGASAGGLEALEDFFRYANKDAGIAYIVIQHLSPDYKSLMLELLSKHTDMNIYRVEDGMLVEPNSIYLIPPKKNMTIFHGKLYLSDQRHNLGLNLPIDIFFRSLAEDLGEKSIGVVLSGTGSDGTLGIRAIKGAGGMVMVQDEDTAKFDGMPRSAIATGLVDYILSPSKMSEQLEKYTKHPYVSKDKGNLSLQVQNDDSLSKILAIIRSQTGTDFTYYKSNTIIRRIERRISVNQLDNIENYLNLILQSPVEINTLYQELLIGVTKFFRDAEVFTTVEDKVIPSIFSSKKGNESLRVWVAGCSTGEEAYSLAIMLDEYANANHLNIDIKIFATDIDKNSIEFASAGIYPESIVADVSEMRLKRYFSKVNNTFRVNENIRKMVIFATHNLIKDPPFSKIDLVSCRNLLIYLQPVMQNKVLSAFSFSLLKNGFLLLGTSETIGDLTSYFNTFESKNKIYRASEVMRNAIIDDYYIPSPVRGRVQTTYDKRAAEKKESDDIFESIMSGLFDDFVPSTVVVNENFELIHIYNDANNYLKIPRGKAQLNITKLVPEDLAIPLSTALHNVKKENKKVIYTDLNFQMDSSINTINLIVKPFKNQRTGIRYFIVIFEEVDIIKSIEGNEQYNRQKNVDQRIADLELELKYTKENLQATIEELETSNEELQATNEELIAANEELQSTNEELQSVNEELYTVNSEYQSKIEELTELNDDINNWLHTTDIGTIFLDLKLKVRKFTPGVEKYVNLIENDIGRPFKHISYNFKYDAMINEIQKVLKTLNGHVKEVRLNNNNWFLLKMQPYRTVENAVKGIVITFIDISDVKNYQIKLEHERNLLISVLENSPNAKTMVDENGRITYANKKAIELLELSNDEMGNKKFNDPNWKITDTEGNTMKDEELPFMKIVSSKQAIYKYVHYIENKNGKNIKLQISGSPILDLNDNVKGAVFSLEEIKNNNEQNIQA